MMSALNNRNAARTEGRRRSLWKLLFRLSLCSCAILMLWCGYVFWTIERFEGAGHPEKADAAIVLGAALWNDVPSPALRERLEHAYMLLENGSVDKLILSGGLGGGGSTLTEAEGMQNYLLAKGVQPDRLLLEGKSTNTYENLLFSHSISEEQGFEKLVIVTHDYHAARAKSIADFVGFNDPQLSPTESEVLNPYYHKGREVLAYTKWQLDKLLMLAGLSSI